MNYFLVLALFYLLTSCAETKREVNKPLSWKEQKKAPVVLTQNAQNLIEHQRQNFDHILHELKVNNRKTSHWIWWVFPTTRQGQSEPSPPSSVTLDDVDGILTQANMVSWSTILETMATLLENNPNPGNSKKPNQNIIPSVDHGRIAYALKFWLQEAGHKTKRNHRFYQALLRLNQFAW